MKRFCVSFVIVLLFLSPNWMPGVAAAAQDEDFFIDPAAMALNSIDLRSNGFDNFGIDQGRFLTGSDVTDWAATELGGAVSGIGGWGFLDGYTVTLSQRATFGIPEVPSTAWVTSTVLRFDNDGGASAVFWELVKATENRDAIPLQSPDNAGREFWVGSMALSTDQRAGSQPGLVAIAHTGTDIGIVFLVPGSELAEIQALSDRLSEKIAILQDTSGPNIGVRTVRLAGDGVSTANAVYFISYGAPTRLTAQTDAAFAGIPVDYPDVVDGFSANQTVSQQDGASWDVRVITLEFPDFASASDWLNMAPDRLAGAEVAEDAASFGDASIALTATTGNNLAIRQMTLQSGAEVAVIEIRGPALVDPAALDALATQQISCFANGCGALPVPVSLRGTIEASPTLEVVSTPDIATPETTPIPSGGTPDVSGTVLTSSTPALTPEPTATIATDQIVMDDALGFQITFDNTVWALVGQDPASDAQGRSRYEFTNGVSGVEILANGAPQGDLLACFDAARTSVTASDKVTNFAAGQNANGDPIFAATADAVQGVFTYTGADGQIMAVFIYCQKTAASPVMITAIATLPAAQFNEQNSAISELLRQIGFLSR